MQQLFCQTADNLKVCCAVPIRQLPTPSTKKVVAFDFRLTLQCSSTFVLLAVNKRLDEWVSEDRLDYSKLQLPKKETKSVSRRTTDSRPSSPEREVVVVSYHWMCCSYAGN